MVNDGSIGTENEEERVPPPNRNYFQRELSRINAEIETLQSQAKVLLNKDGRPGSITQSRLEKETIRSQRSELAHKAESAKKQIAQLRKQKEALKSTRLELEKECRVRSQGKLDSYLKNCEERYNSQNLSRKEESLLVEEINDLKRNRNKLEKLAEVLKTLQATDEKINSLNEANGETYREIFRLKAEQHAKSAIQWEKTQRWQQIRSDLDVIHGERRDLIGNYNANRENYAEWAKKHKKKSQGSNSSYPATFPTVRNRTTSIMEEEELEPFFEQKRDCQRLIIYLERLKAQIDTSETTPAPEQGTESDSDSADEFPASFARLHVVHKNGVAKNESLLKQKKHGTRKIIKLTQPISHVFEIYNLFVSVAVPVPSVFQDVPGVLEEVKGRLAFYNQQTNVIDWYEEYKDFEATLHPMSRSVSEYTGDSACIDSETASLASSRLQPSSPAENKNFQVQSFTNDEGICSKESNQGYVCQN